MPSAAPPRKRPRTPTDSDENSSSETQGLNSVSAEQEVSSHTAGDPSSQHASPISADEEKQSETPNSSGSTKGDRSGSDSGSDSDPSGGEAASESSTKEAETDEELESGRNAEYRKKRTQGISSNALVKLNGCLHFANDKDVTKFHSLRSRRIVQGKSLDEPTVSKLNLRSVDYISGTVWETFFAIQCNSYYELIYEFYTTFTFNKKIFQTCETEGVVSFRLMNQFFSFSINDFNVILGFLDGENVSADSTNACTAVPKSFNCTKIWKSFTSNTSGPYSNSRSKDFFFKDPSLVYLHRLLAYSFSGRNDASATVTQTELFMLWCIRKKKPINLGSFLASQFSATLATRGPLKLGHVITHLAVSLGIIDTEKTDLHVAHKELDPLNFERLNVMKLICRKIGSPGFVLRCAGMDKEEGINLENEPEIQSTVHTNHGTVTEQLSILTSRFEHAMAQHEERMRKIEEARREYEMNFQNTMQQLKESIDSLRASMPPPDAP